MDLYQDRATQSTQAPRRRKDQEWHSPLSPLVACSRRYTDGYELRLADDRDGLDLYRTLDSVMFSESAMAYCVVYHSLHCT